LQFAVTTIVNIYAKLVVRWPYELLCTMVTVGSQERQILCSAAVGQIPHSTECIFSCIYFCRLFLQVQLDPMIMIWRKMNKKHYLFQNQLLWVS